MARIRPTGVARGAGSPWGEFLLGRETAPFRTGCGQAIPCSVASLCSAGASPASAAVRWPMGKARRGRRLQRQPACVSGLLNSSHPDFRCVSGFRATVGSGGGRSQWARTVQAGSTVDRQVARGSNTPDSMDGYCRVVRDVLWIVLDHRAERSQGSRCAACGRWLSARRPGIRGTASAPHGRFHSGSCGEASRAACRRASR